MGKVQKREEGVAGEGKVYEKGKLRERRMVYKGKGEVRKGRNI